MAQVGLNGKRDAMQRGAGIDGGREVVVNINSMCVNYLNSFTF